MRHENIDCHMRLGLKVAYYRKLSGLTQRQLAAEIGRNTSYVSALEAPNVARGLSVGALFDISKALGVPAIRLRRRVALGQRDARLTHKTWTSVASNYQAMFCSQGIKRPAYMPPAFDGL